MLWSINSIVSSVYYRIEGPSCTRCGIKPVIFPSSLALDISKASIPATKLNNKGDKGSPCLKPLFF
jgi:hypothetical protein